MPYDVGAPLLAVQFSVTVPVPADAVRLAGPLGEEAVAGVTVSSSAREIPWPLVAPGVIEFLPAFR